MQQLILHEDWKIQRYGRVRLSSKGEAVEEYLCICCGELPAIPHQSETAIGADLCGPCRRAGCNGVLPCLVPAEFWVTSRYVRALHDAWMAAHQLEKRWLQGEVDKDFVTPLHQSISGDWTPVTNSYWRRETSTSIGPVIAEVLRIEVLDGYVAEIRTDAPIDSRFAGQPAGLGCATPKSLTQALAECDRLITKLIAHGPSGEDFRIS
jgi:hypothetical protein